MNKVSIIYRAFGFLFLIISIHGCQIDNYDEPSSLLKGHVVYEGKPIGVKATGGTVQLQLWQSGYGTETPIAVNVAQDGSYSIMLFDGEYRLVAKDGNGPWENRHDEIHFTLKGGAILDYPVVPYYTISNVQFIPNDNKTELTAKFTVTQVGESQGLASVFLLIGKTRFIDLATTVKQATSSGTTGEVTLTIDLSDLSKEKALFARVGARIKNVDEAVYSTEIYSIR